MQGVSIHQGAERKPSRKLNGVSSSYLGGASTFLVFLVPLPTQSLRPYRSYEACDETQPAEDVDDGEEFADSRCGSEIS